MVGATWGTKALTSQNAGIGFPSALVRSHGTPDSRNMHEHSTADDHHEGTDNRTDVMRATAERREGFELPGTCGILVGGTRVLEFDQSWPTGGGSPGTTTS